MPGASNNTESSRKHVQSEAEKGNFHIHKKETTAYRFKDAFEGVIINAISQRVVHCIVLAFSGSDVLERKKEKIMVVIDR